MKKITFVTLISALMILKACPANSYTILMFGDSITQGYQRTIDLVEYGILYHPQGTRVTGSYGPALEELLSQHEPSYCYNWGWDGELTTTGMNRIEKALQSRKADFILILEGANDIKNGVSIATTRFNLKVMIEKAKAYGVKPILGEVTPLTCPLLCNYSPYVISLNREIAALARSRGILLAEFFTQFNDGWNTIPLQSGDGIHISDNGYMLFAELWYQTLLSAITPAEPPKYPTKKVKTNLNSTLLLLLDENLP